LVWQTLQLIFQPELDMMSNCYAEGSFFLPLLTRMNNFCGQATFLSKQLRMQDGGKVVGTIH
jgi:hypothetical protein